MKWAPAPDDAMAVLGPWLARRRADGAGPEAFVFARADGSHLRKEFVEWHWERVHDALGLGLTFYEATRHSFASRNLSHGVPLDEVASALGHSTPAVTARHYAHFIRKTFSAGMRAPLQVPGARVAGKVLQLSARAGVTASPQHRGQSGKPPAGKDGDTEGRCTVTSQDERERTAFHEAGHYVAGSTRGVNWDVRLSIRPSDDGTLGRVIGEALDRAFNPSTERIEAHVIALCAGYVAQRRFDPNQPDGDAVAGARSDFDEVDEWADVITRAEAITRAANILSEHWVEVEAVARGLLMREEFDAEEADFLMTLAIRDEYERGRAEWLLRERGWTADEIRRIVGSVSQ